MARIQNGAFGFCEGLGTPIEETRLGAIPWTRYSLEYARMVESGKAPKNDNFRRRPIDIQRETDDEKEEEEDTLDTEDVELLEEDMDEESSDSLDQLQEEEDYEEDNEDIERQRSA